MINYIKELLEQHQIVLSLFYIQEYKLYEIVEILTSPTETVKSRLFYAIEKLNSIINNRNYEKP